jgi:hypothetical protein
MLLEQLVFVQLIQSKVNDVVANPRIELFLKLLCDLRDACGPIAILPYQRGCPIKAMCLMAGQVIHQHFVRHLLDDQALFTGKRFKV